MMAFAIIGCLGGIIVQMENCLAIANMVNTHEGFNLQAVEASEHQSLHPTNIVV